MKVSSRSIMEVSLHIRYERYLDENRNRSGKMRLIRGYFIFGICGMKLKEEKKKGPHGHSSVKSTSCGCHGNGTGVEHAGGVASTWRDEWVLRESAYTLRSLHPPSFSIPFLLFAYSPTLQPLSAMAPSAWMLHHIADTWSVTRLWPQDAKVEHASYFYLFLSFLLDCLTEASILWSFSNWNFIFDFSLSLALIFFCAYVINYC